MARLNRRELLKARAKKAKQTLDAARRRILQSEQNTRPNEQTTSLKASSCFLFVTRLAIEGTTLTRMNVTVGAFSAALARAATVIESLHPDEATPEATEPGRNASDEEFLAHFLLGLWFKMLSSGITVPSELSRFVNELQNMVARLDPGESVLKLAQKIPMPAQLDRVDIPATFAQARTKIWSCLNACASAGDSAGATPVPEGASAGVPSSTTVSS